MALQHLRSSTANKRPLPAGMSDGQLAINTNLASPGLFLKNSNGDLVKVGPVHVGTTAPNASPAAGGETGNTTGELWLDTSVTPNQLKTWNGSAWVSDFPDEIPVAKLADGAARQLLQTDAAGTGVEWTSNVDVPGTLDVTGATTLDSTLTVPLGSAAAPTVRFTGDTNTGIYSPGADQVAISTNGTGRLFVDASGNVAVGKTSANAKFHVSNAGVEGIEIEPGGLSGSNLTRHYNRNSNAYINSNIYALNHIFYAATSEVMRLDSSGRLGLGTSSPQKPLHVATSDGRARFEATGTDGAGGIELVNDARRYQVQVNGGISDAFQIYDATGSASRMVIDTSGNVGIGTTSPNELFEVRGTSDQGIRLTSTAGSGEGANLQWYSEQTGDNKITAEIESDGQGTGGNLQFKTRTTGGTLAEAVRIDNAQRVLVGTSASPSAGLGQYARISAVGYTGSATGEGVMTIARGKAATSMVSGDTVGQLSFTDINGNDFAKIICSADATPGSGDYPGVLTFSTTADGASSPTERMRIDSAGFVSFGGDTNTGFSKPSADNLAIATGGSERARIDSSGRLLVGTSTVPAFSSFTAGKFALVDGSAQIVLVDNGDGAVWSSFSASKSIGMAAGGSYNTNTGYAWLKLNPSTTASSVLVTANSNGVTLSHNATSWSASSDERNKTDLKPITNALDKVTGLRAVTGRYKNDDNNVSRSFLIAQDVLAALPEAVDTADSENLGLRYTEVIPLLVAALKESKERIEHLEAAVATLQTP